jgi:hypothetical protein
MLVLLHFSHLLGLFQLQDFLVLRGLFRDGFKNKMPRLLVALLGEEEGDEKPWIEIY